MVTPASDRNALAAKLNPRQRLLVEKVAGGMSAAQAYAEAGFSPNGAKVSASRLLTNA